MQWIAEGWPCPEVYTFSLGSPEFLTACDAGSLVWWRRFFLVLDCFIAGTGGLKNGLRRGVLSGMNCMRPTTHWRLRSRTLELGRRTLVMGVVNITPDSFSDGFSLVSEECVARAINLIEDGADIVDLGAESTRPGSKAGGPDALVSSDEEQARLLPVLEGVLKARPDAVVSVDTYKAETARAALEAGAEIINEVSGFTWEPAIAEVCAALRAGAVLSHTRGRPDEWRSQPQLETDALLAMVQKGLTASVAAARRAGIVDEAIVIDPGYGFGKRFDENYALLARQAELLSLGRPLLAGLSRKSFLGHTLAPLFGGQPAPMDARENASLAAMTTAILNGASIVRVHAVRPAVEAARIADAILEKQGNEGASQQVSESASQQVGRARQDSRSSR
jgi:dihydropteroate synthase